MKPIRISRNEHTQPMWVKPVLMVLFVLACFAVFFIQHTPRPLQAKPVTDQQRVVDSEQLSTIEPQIAEINHALANIHPQLQELTEQQSILQEQQTILNNQDHKQQQHINQLEKTLSTVLHQLTQLQQSQHKPKQVKRVVKRHKPRLSNQHQLPTLRLASIDLWGETQTAVLEDNNQLITLRQGEQYNDWRLINIDLEQQKIELMNTSQKQLILSRP